MAQTLSPSDIRALASGAYHEITEDAPAEIPDFMGLSSVEREHLIRFAEALFRRAGMAS